MTTDLDALLEGVDGERMAPDGVDTTTLVAVCRFVVATAWLAATAPATLPSLIGD
jgi:hypothetical protein